MYFPCSYDGPIAFFGGIISPYHHPKYRVSINDWYTFGDKIRENYRAFPHKAGISGKSNSQRFQYAKTNSFTSVQGAMWLLSVGLCTGTSSCHLYHWILMNLSWELPQLSRQLTEHVRKSMGWAGLQTGHLSGHKWSSHWASLGYVKLSEFVIQMALVTTI
jgi:hypothetical protein